MKFLRQIKFEIRNILRSRFLLIIAIILIFSSIAIPAISFFTQKAQNNGNNVPTYGPVRDISYAGNVYPTKFDYYGGKGETITINGIEIPSSNPFYWQIFSFQQDQQSIEKGLMQFKYPEAQDLALEMIDLEIAYYLRFAAKVAKYEDYRYELAGRGYENLMDKFYYENADKTAEILSDATMYRKGMDPESIRTKYINISAAERQKALAKVDDSLEMIFSIVDKDDFGQYIEWRLQQEADNITNLEKSIDVQVQAILANPSQAENLNQVIDNLEKQIKVIKESTIPLLEYRREKNIRPGENVWQNTALSDIENSQNQLAYMTIMTEEQFNKNGGSSPTKPVDGSYYYPGGGNYTTYDEYVAYMNKQINQLNKTIIIARKSLDSNKPDMKYVPGGSRYKTNDFLGYSLFVALFGVLLGGWLIASEHQQGTIRLLMIRPKTRTKILLAKFCAAFLVCILIDLAGSFANALANGAFYGFADFFNPNYTITGTVGFAVYFLPRFIACLLPVLFAFTAAFMLSVIVRNTAVAIAVPIVIFIASTITMGLYSFNSNMNWLAYTPIPYIQLSAFFQPNSMFSYIIQNAPNISLTYGIVLLLALSTAFTLISAAVFKMKDITN